ncbi:MAG: hypothetical protein WAK33_19265 [Silvibacterium sp.]
MKSFSKIGAMMAVLTLMSAMPLTAQIVNGLTFKTSFPFYVGYAKMPAGSYTITQSIIDPNTLNIESADGKYSTYFDCEATQTEQPHAKTDVTFNRYGSTDYLNRIWIEGQQSGFQVLPTKAEQKAAASGAPQQHSVTGAKR